MMNMFMKIKSSFTFIKDAKDEKTEILPVVGDESWVGVFFCAGVATY